MVQNPAWNCDLNDGPRGVNIELPFKAYYRADAGRSASIITLVNNQEQY